jgi:lysozyme
MNAPKAQFVSSRPSTNVGAEQVSSAIDKLVSTHLKEMKRKQVKEDQESIRAAQADLVRNTIDPERVQNDMFYSASITRNFMQTAYEKIQNDLQDPASELSTMDPDDFQKYINEQTDTFDKNNTGKYAHVNAAVYNKFMAANQPKLVAMHAAQYKQQIKNGQFNHALMALSKTPQTMSPEAFNLSTAELIESIIPKTMFTSTERRNIIMAAAVNSSRNGDRRMLDYAIENYGVDATQAEQVAVAENLIRKWDKNQTADYWNTQYKAYEEKARSGQFTKEDWDDLIINQEAIDRLGGRSQIDSWLRDGDKSRQNSAMLYDFYNKFNSSTPIIGATPKQYDAVIEQVMAEGAINGDDPMETMTKVVMKMADQNMVSNSIKATMNSALGRQVWTPAVAQNEQFQQSFTIATIMNKHMSNEQLKRQMGDDAYDTFKFLDNELKFNGGDFSAAIASYAAATQKRKEHGLEAHLTSQELKAMQTATDDVFAGNFDTSDPSVTKFFGLISKAGDSLFTGGVRADMQAAAERLILKGWSPEAAIEQAGRKVAANYSEFGGELHFTGGAGSGPVFGFPSGTDAKTMDRGWEFYAEQLGKDPGDLAPTLSGGMVTIVDKTTGEELPPVPATVIGELWEHKQLQDLKEQKAEDEHEDLQNRQETADMFQQILYNKYGILTPGANFATVNGKPVTIEDYERADLDGKIEMYDAWHREFSVGTQRFAKMLVTACDFWMDKGTKLFNWFGDRMSAGEALPGDEPLDEGYRSTQEDIDAAAPPQRATDDIPAQPITSDAESAAPKDAPSGTATQIMKHEGFRGSPYKDSVGVETVGYGRNLEANPITQDEWKALGGRRDLNKEPLTEDEAAILFQNDLKVATKDAKSLFSGAWDDLSEQRRKVLIDMTFNLGRSKLSKFKTMRKYLNAGDFEKVADSMQNSKWFQQVHGRGTTLVQQMREG